MASLFLHYAACHRRGILHFFLPQATIFGGILSCGWHRRCIASQRGMLSHRGRQLRLLTWIERIVLRCMVANLANSEGIADVLVSEGIPREKVRIIHSGLSPDRMNPVDADRRMLRGRFQIAENTFAIVTLANLFPYKGHQDLVKALGLLQAKGGLGTDWKLFCIGRDIGADGLELEYSAVGSHQKVLEEQAACAGIAPHTVFLGDRRDAPALLRMMDLAVQPSHEEGFSNAVIEALAAGLPVVATQVPGNAEALDAGRLGMLVPPRDPSALAQAIGALYGAPEQRASIGREALTYVREKFSLRTVVDEYEAVYRNVLAGSQRGEDSRH
jgi:glycosyltransferase involved in cell wall biosynthesis